MAKTSNAGLGFQRPPGYDIGGDAVPSHHAGKELPIPTRGASGPSEFQPPSGEILGDDLPVGDSLQGMTDNVLGGGTRSDLAAGCLSLTDNPSLESLNPSTINAAEPPLPPGFLGRQNGWDR